MMTAAQHYAEADRLAEIVAEATGFGPASERLTALAQVHATLATVPHSVVTTALAADRRSLVHDEPVLQQAQALADSGLLASGLPEGTHVQLDDTPLLQRGPYGTSKEQPDG